MVYFTYKMHNGGWGNFNFGGGGGEELYTLYTLFDNFKENSYACNQNLQKQAKT